MTATTSKTFGETGIGYEFREGAESMKAGKYQVTDPCYFLGHDDDFWSAFCDFMFPGQSHRSDCYTIEIAGHKVFAWGTLHGDGCYPTKKDGCEIGESGVDAGMLALVPVELFTLLGEHLGTNDDSNAPIVEVKSNFTPEVDDGNCSFEKYETITGDEEEECERCGSTYSVGLNSLCDDCQREVDEEEEREEEERRLEEEEEDE